MKDIKLLFSLVMLTLAMCASAQTTWITAGESFTDGTLVYWIKNYPNGYKSAESVNGANAHKPGDYTYADGTGVLQSGEVAVSLLKNETITVTDTIRITRGWSTTYYKNTLDKLTTEYDKNVRKLAADVNKETSCVIDGMTFTYLGNLQSQHRDVEYTHYAYPSATSTTLRDNKTSTDNPDYAKRQHYKREGLKLAGSTTKNVTIPATITAPDGTDYKVGVIAYAGFIYPKSTTMKEPYCSGGKQWANYYEILPGGNDYLENVTFAPNSNVRLILGYAFFGCSQLRSITIPRTVTSIGSAAFELCWMLSNVVFQTNENSNESALRTIGSYAFEGDPFVSLTLPEGLTEIGGSAFRYNLRLQQINLPNSLTKVGSHFLCCAKQLKTVTIPAALVNLDGALFHGCESLEEIYCLGYAENLKSKDAEGTTFASNYQYCADGVALDRVKLYVPSTYLDDYKNNTVWNQIQNVEETPGAYRDFTGGKWATVAFPKGVSNYKSVFGQNSKCAVMTSAKREKDWVQDPQTGKWIVMYTLNFELISGANIPEDKPVLLNPQNDVHYQMWAATDETADFIKDMTNDHAYGVTASNDEDADNNYLDAYITMNSQYVPYKMKVWDFYLTTKDEVQTFRRVPSVDKAATVGATRCYWTVRVNGLPAETTVNNAHEAFFYDDTDAVTRIVVDGDELGIYDLQGRRLSAPMKGINIVNGKKIFIQ